MKYGTAAAHGGNGSGRQVRLDDVVDAMRCQSCHGTGHRPLPTPVGSIPRPGECRRCSGSGIDPDVLEDAEGWGTWAISVHDHPGRIVVVPLD